MPRLSVFLVDDHPIVREGLRALLERQPDFTVAGEASAAPEVLDRIDRLQPNVLLLDLVLPGLNGLEVLRQVRQRAPATRVLILSMYSGEPYVLEALRAGASGYCLKSVSSSELLAALRTVAAGGRYLSPPLTDRVLDVFIQQAGAAGDAYSSLTAREREVLSFAAEGHSNVYIADRLSISARTVESHRANFMRKLRLHSTTDLIRYAMRRGLIPPMDGGAAQLHQGAQEGSLTGEK